MISVSYVVCGTAVSAVRSCGRPGRTGVLTSTEMPELRIKKRFGSYLPHWTEKGGVYSVAFRLVDSVPQERLEEWRSERSFIVEEARRAKRRLSADEMTRMRALKEQRTEQYLDLGHGECWLRRDDIAEAVADALRHFDGERYRLFTWCIMPNHVHVVFQALKEWKPSQILHSWKSFTAKEANKILGRTGAFWQIEYYDHLIREKDDFFRTVEYVWSNPEQSGHKSWKWRWKAEGIEV